MKQFKDRRKDSELRAAYNRFQRNARGLDDKRHIYKHLLKELCAISRSADGFILEKNIETQPEGAQLGITCHRLKGARAKQKKNLSAVDIPWQLMSFFTDLQSGINTNKTRVFRDTEGDMINLSQLGLPLFKQLLVITIINIRGKVLALLCLADSDIPYSDGLAARVWPLLASAAQLLSHLQQPQRHPDYYTRAPAVLDDREIVGATEAICPLALIAVDENYRVIRFNPAAEQLFGTPVREALQKSISHFIPERFSQEHRSKIFTGSTFSMTPHAPLFLSGRHASERHIPIEVFVVRYCYNRRTHFLLYINDNTELTAVKAAQEDQIQRFKAVSDLAPIGILQTNRHWQAVYVNDQWCEICGLAQEEAAGKGWINAFYHEDVSHTLESLRKAIVDGQAFDGECRLQTPVGDIVWVEFHARPLFNADGSMDGFIATLTDCTYRRITEHKLRTMAERDSLTGLANRAMFQSRLDHAMERSDRHGALALLCLDLDGFKNVNDTLGHDAGDLLLVEVAERLKTCVRTEDTVARVGGDEFMILLEGLQEANIAAEIAAKILPSLARPYYIGSQEVFISTSIGITFANAKNGFDAKTLIKQADIALYRAKAEGRNNFQYYSPELEKASKDRLYLSNSLHRALERNEFQVFYQLQADISTKRVVGTEALLRWQHPERGLLPPDEFIELLEETRLIGPVSRWLWHRAFCDHKKWCQLGLLDKHSHIAVNLSPRQLRDPNLIVGIEGAIKEAGISGGAVVIEITESALIEDSPHTISVLHALKALGAKIALDDFGTGYSSLTYLKRYAIDLIKIDKTFIGDILTDAEDSAITQAVLALAKSLGLEVVAEGVDSLETLQQLERWGCNSYQGYFLNRPSPCDEALKVLQKYRDGDGDGDGDCKGALIKFELPKS